jgi:uncharacterized protein (DUF1800 family)
MAYSKAVTAILLAFSIAMPTVAQTTAKKKPAPSASTAAHEPATLTERQRAIHALNRLTFGPRPGDLDTVLSKGVDAWIEDQLHPESIDDGALNGRLAPYATTRMSLKQLAESFPSDTTIRQVIGGKRQAPPDSDLALVYSVNIARIKEQDAPKTAPPAAASAAAPAGAANNAATASPPTPSPAEDRARSIGDSLLAAPKNLRMAALKIYSPEELIDFLNRLRPDQRNRLIDEATPQERETLRALSNPSGVIANELPQAKLMREIYSERQLLEVMTDFWFNHFNVYLYKNQDVYYTTPYERDVIRGHALGKFYDLLLATAQSPAMLMYLDNWQSLGPHSPAAGKSGGLNENYGREVMELHTLGVDGGYTQADVTALATIFTGWTIAQPDDAAQFQFDPKRHEPGSKTVLGEKFYEGGNEEGLRALDMLAHHPSTAQFISKCLATRFVSDDPPESLVRRMAATFQSSDGDIREVLRTMFHSPEFWSPKVYRAKLKTPLEFAVSAVRASASNVVAPDALLQNLNAMGMQPFGMAVPTGYSMKGESWESDNAILARINFAGALTQNKLSNVQFDPANLMALGTLTSSDLPRTKAVLAAKHTSLDASIALLEDTIMGGELPGSDEAIIRKQMQQPDLERRMKTQPVEGMRFVAGFILASPEFQHR